MMSFIILLAVILIVAILITIFRAHTLVQVMREKDSENIGNSNNINAILFMVFLVAGTILFFGYSYTQFDRYTVPVASEHGEITFQLFWITMGVTCFVFILTHIFLFYFAYKYKHQEGQTAYFYPHNNTLELIWTIVPAIVLTLLVMSGFSAWSKITSQAPENAEVVEITGFQFAWAFRYPGKDKQLGDYHYQLIDSENAVGIDFTDKNSLDDFMSREIHIPKGKPVLFKIRARDVIHSVYIPWFRMQMNAVPGMPTQFWFVPSKTTAEMREETGNEEFQYELVCNKICGNAHFSMRGIVVVDEPEEYEKWYASQKSWLSKNPDYTAQVGNPKAVETVASIGN
ncbi:MAG: cytochrome c oxidase subunit II [Cyclobacteriaceae bacterium]